MGELQLAERRPALPVPDAQSPVRKKKDTESGKAGNHTLDQQGAQRRPARAVPERGQQAGARSRSRAYLQSRQRQASHTEPASATAAPSLLAAPSTPAAARPTLQLPRPRPRPRLPLRPLQVSLRPARDTPSLHEAPPRPGLEAETKQRKKQRAWRSRLHVEHCLPGPAPPRTQPRVLRRGEESQGLEKAGEAITTLGIG